LRAAIEFELASRASADQTEPLKFAEFDPNTQNANPFKPTPKRSSNLRHQISKTQIYQPFLYKFAAVKPNLNAYLRIYSCFRGIIAKISQRMKNDDKKNYFTRRIYRDDADGMLH